MKIQKSVVAAGQCIESQRKYARSLGQLRKLNFSISVRIRFPCSTSIRTSTTNRIGFSSNAIRTYCRRLRVQKGHILIEPLNRYESRYANTVAESLRLVARVDSPNIGLLLDCFHMSIEERSIVDAIVAAGCHTKHVHLAENNRKMPGEGSLEWPAIFGALRTADTTGPSASSAPLRATRTLRFQKA
jgi:hydroxypyruvate isomerase